MKAMKTERTVAANTGPAKATGRATRTGVGAKPAGAEPLATQGKRTAVGARSRVPARHGASAASTQGPEHLQGRAGPARAGTRPRAKKS